MEQLGYTADPTKESQIHLQTLQLQPIITRNVRPSNISNLEISSSCERGEYAPKCFNVFQSVTIGVQVLKWVPSIKICSQML